MKNKQLSSRITRYKQDFPCYLWLKIQAFLHPASVNTYYVCLWVFRSMCRLKTVGQGFFHYVRSLGLQRQNMFLRDNPWTCAQWTPDPSSLWACAKGMWVVLALCKGTCAVLSRWVLFSDHELHFCCHRYVLGVLFWIPPPWNYLCVSLGCCNVIRIRNGKF